jgi:uncharacterized protein YrrD
MLLSVERLKGYEVRATDGEMGKIDALFFEDNTWRVRYIVVDVGGWLTGRRVLIVPTAVDQIDTDAEQVVVSLTKEQVENSPEVVAHPPISREKEIALHEHYRWQGYWPLGFTGPAVSHPRRSLKVDSNLRSTAEVTGYNIQANDGQVGRVEDFVFDELWRVRYVLVDTGNWLPGRKVLISPGWVERVQWLGCNVHVDLTRDSVESSPAFDPQKPISADYAAQLDEHYKEWFAKLMEQTRFKEERKAMLLGKNLIGNPVVAVSDGRIIGKVQDLYLAADLESVIGIFLGSEGLFRGTNFLVNAADIVTLGVDAVLAEHSDVIHREDEVAEAKNWVRRDDLQGRPVDTSGGTKVGQIGDIVVKMEGEVRGFSLSRVYVKGPVAERGSVALHTMLDAGSEDAPMTIDLEKAEQQQLTVE